MVLTYKNYAVPVAIGILKPEPITDYEIPIKDIG
jgi:hypothetical protein